MTPNTLAQLELRPPVRNALASHTMDFLGRSFAEDPTDIDDASPETEVGGEFQEAVDGTPGTRWRWMALVAAAVAVLGVAMS